MNTSLATHGATCTALADYFFSPDGTATPLPLPPDVARTDVREGNSWPHARPEFPRWTDVSLKLHLQHVSVRFGGSQASFDYRDIDGFTDRRGHKKPNRVWTMLRAFAMKQGALPLPTKAADPVRVRTLADLEHVLGRFFGIDGDALDRDLEGRTVRCRFRVSIGT